MTPPDLPRERAPDGAPGLLRDGYVFAARRCARLGTDAFRTRLGGRAAVVMRGEDAARLFYGGGAFTRRGALPRRTVRQLQGVGSVQWLDGAAHRHRKAMFMAMVAPASVARLEAAARARWREAIARWTPGAPVTLLDEAAEVFCRAACDWTGVPLADAEARRRTADLAALVDGAGAAGPRHWRGRLARRRAERWCRGLVAATRDGRIAPAADAPLATVARHADPDGRLLPLTIAARELLNLLRPSVAVAWYVAGMVVALDRFPAWRARLAADDDLVEPFVHEVRRLHPFIPMMGGRALRDLPWRGTTVPRGTWVLLDLFGTGRDPRTWDDAERFRPERFAAAPPGRYAMVPQGGGDPMADHRCPGEGPTVALMAVTARLLARELAWSLPSQDLRMSRRRFPARPRSGVRIVPGAP